MLVDWSRLLLPIALSAVFVFIASSVIHMVLRYHNRDYKKLPNEDAVAAAIRQGGGVPAQYVFPHCADHAQMNSPEMAKKFAEGPCGLLYLRQPGNVNMGAFLGKWFGYLLLVSFVVAYLARAELAPGSGFLPVFRLVGTATWLAYAFQGPADSIWKGKPWAVTGKEMFDGLVYALVTGCTFAWLWPSA